ncbi:SDR family NAD(P)-dependent oxidoreductase [Aliikangiella sp. IMCC44359]|uniref:SDR family NAD(P)-dependent oxidoreductase n=1 Tax=Aliikangiella sp. IMCC44359 TaxID=3459125 RepID=UPI00403AF1D9
MTNLTEIISAYNENKLSVAQVKSLLESLKKQQASIPTNAQSTQEKPCNISLLSTSEIANEVKVSQVLEKPVITLMPLADSAQISKPMQKVEKQVAQVSLVDYGQGVYALDFKAENNKELVWSESLIHCLQQGFASIAEKSDAKVLLLRCESLSFMPESFTDNEKEYFYQQKIPMLPVKCQIPVVAVLKSNCAGLGWLLAAQCDFMICAEEGNYHYCDQLNSAELALFDKRFKHHLARQLLLSEKAVTGLDLQQAGFGMLVTKQSEVDSCALELAQKITQAPQNALTLLKQHLAQDIVTLTEKMLAQKAPPINFDKHQQTDGFWQRYGEVALSQLSNDLVLGQAQNIEINSSVVSLQAYANGVALVTFAETQSRNTFTNELVNGITNAFAEINRSDDFKVVVLTGYEQYFACGGTKENLLDIHSGKIKFTDTNIYRLPLETSIPVISAMQGHSIGAGWSMGMYSDCIIFSEKHIYNSPYMKYGFTPGAGATLAFPEKLGMDLGREILFSADEYKGIVLKKRYAELPVVAQADVLKLAMIIANDMAKKSRQQLQKSKAQYNQSINQNTAKIFEQEQAMHQLCFVNNDEVLTRIQQHFNDPTKRDVTMSSQVTNTVEDNNSDETDLQQIIETLRKTLADELLIDEEALDNDMKFIDIGLDSVMGVNWLRSVNKSFGLSINATKVYSHPTVQEFADYVLEEGKQNGLFQTNNQVTNDENQVELASNPVENLIINQPLEVQSVSTIDTIKADKIPQPKVATKNLEPVVKEKVATKDQVIVEKVTAEKITKKNEVQERTSNDKQALPKIAVVGMAGQFPKAENLDAFWQNLADGRDCISEVPQNRWDIDKYYDVDTEVPGKSNSKWMGVLDSAEHFDPRFFNISPREAEWMDPQQRIFLQSAWQCIEDAGYNSRSLAGSKCGVFVGAGQVDYAQATPRTEFNSQYFMGKAISILAAKISYLLNLQGPCVTIDTACSSSLVAMASACDSLAMGTSDVALAGGVCVLAGPDMHIMTAKSGMLSADGRCFTFDQNANGFVPGEGVGVLMLKRLEDAEADGDQIHGVISGWGVNQDGKTNGITAPNPESQAALEKEVYQRHNIDPATISLVEAHGTGTKLGDPIEVEGLKESFAAFTNKKDYCALGSVKSNIGHLLTAAGVAGAIKLLLSIKHQQIPPMPNFKKLNEHIDFKNSPFYINQGLVDWHTSENQIRRSAVSSFGFSGTNAHIVIEEYQAKVQHQRNAIKPNSSVAIVLSAKTEERLQAYAADLLNYLNQNDERTLNLENIAYTLQVGRDAMEHRLAIKVDSVLVLKQKLQSFIDGNKSIKDLYQGGSQGNSETIGLISESNDLQEVIQNWVEPNQLSKLLRLWVKGVNLDWHKRYQRLGLRPAKMSLPTYPFAEESYWLAKNNTEFSSHTQNGQGTVAVKHPLLHENTSNLFSAQQYSSRFTGEEFFFAHHIIKGGRVLPGVGHLEMVRAAVEQACGDSVDTTFMQIKNVVWMRPIVGPKENNQNHQVTIHISLTMEPGGEISYRIFSGSEDDISVHSQGIVILNAPREIPQRDLALLQSQCTQGSIEAQDYFVEMKEKGAELGPGFQGIDNFYLGTNEHGNSQVLTRITITDTLEFSPEQFILHPTTLDAAVHTFPPLLIESGDLGDAPLSIPFALEELTVNSQCNGDMWALARHSAGSVVGGSVTKYDIDLLDDEGNVCVSFKGLAVRAIESVEGHESNHLESDSLESDNIEPISTLMVHPKWHDKPISANSVNSPSNNSQNINRVVVVCENETLAGLENQLTSAKVITLQSSTDENRYLDFAKALFNTVKDLFYQRTQSEGSQAQLLIQVVTAEPLLAGLSGMIKTLMLENAKVSGQLIEVEASSNLGNIIQQINENQQSSDKHIRYQNNRRQIVNFEPLKQSDEQPPVPYKEKGIYLITGGAGALGFLLAEDISTQLESATVILTGRSRLNSDKQYRLRALQKQSSVIIEYRQVDVTDKDQVDELVKNIVQQYDHLDGIIHAAGMIKDNFILKKDEQELLQVMTPKVAGLINLDAASDKLDLDFFVLFSSISSAIGNSGQADYSMANAFLDTYADYRNALKEKKGLTLSINWPLWEEGGMAIDEQTEQWMRDNTGMVPLKTTTGIDAFYRALNSSQSQIMITEGIVTKMKQRILAQSAAKAAIKSTNNIQNKMPAKQEVVAVQQKRVVTTRSPQAAPQITAAPVVGSNTGGQGNTEGLMDTLKSVVAEILKISQSEIDIDKEFNTYGFDSITLTELTNNLNKLYAIPSARALNPTLFFEYPNLRSFSQYLAEECEEVAASINKSPAQSSSVQNAPIQQVASTSVAQEEMSDSSNLLAGLSSGRQTSTVTSVVSEETTVAQPQQNVDIAVVGMSARLPMANNIDEFWQNLVDGRDCISEIPADRWNWRAIYGDPAKEVNKTDIKYGGFIEGVEEFDPLFFGISPREALLIDPMQRLLMQHIWQAIEDAGYSASSISGNNTGVFLGSSVSEYGKLLNLGNVPFDAFMPTGRSASLGANRMSYYLNLTGPSETIDTACSSSLVAIHRAVEAMKNGHCDSAIVGGVNTLLAPDGHVSFRKAGMLSVDGRCKTFSKHANGYARGEGVGIMMLKKLSDAERDGDHIYGLIKGSGENHGGRANSLTAPNPKAQADLLSGVYSRAQIDPRTVGYIEAHGTGTELGDPVEVNGMKMAFKDLYKATGDTSVRDTHVGIGSAKSNIGHLELGAGAAGAIKVLLQLKHKTLAKSLHNEELNPYIQLENTPFRVIGQTEPWPAICDEQGNEFPRRAGVSSFGFGGANAHIVFEEYVGQAPVVNQEANAEHLVVLSAKNEERLKARAQQLLDALTDGKTPLANQSVNRYSDKDLINIVYTLQVGREPMEQRMGFKVNSLEQLCEKLKQYLNNEEVAGLYAGKVERNDEMLGLFADDNELEEAVSKWVERNKTAKLLSLWVKGYDFDWNKLYANYPVLPQRISLPVYPFAQERHWPNFDIAQLVPGEENRNQPNVIKRQTRYLGKGWQAIPLNKADKSRLPEGVIVILANNQTLELANKVAEQLTNSYIANADESTELSSIVKSMQEQSANYAGCIDLIGCGNEQTTSLEWLPLLQQMIEQAKPEQKSLYLCVTQGLELFNNEKVNLAGAGRVGLYRMLQSEYGNKLRAYHIDDDPISDDDLLVKHIVSEWQSDNQKVNVCYRSDKRYTATLQKVMEPQEKKSLAFPDNEVLMITGGTRGIGLLCAEHFVSAHGVKKLVLTGREQIPPAFQWPQLLSDENSQIANKVKALQKLKDQGVEVYTLSLSLSDEEALAEQVKWIQSNLGPIRGVLHCAGLNDWENPAFIRKPLESISKVLQPKVEALDVMLRCLREQPLEFFALFSSVSAIVPSLGTGQADYAMANAYMDYFAMANASELPIKSIQWPSWKETGMGEANSRAYKATGFLSHTNVEGLKLLDSVLSRTFGPVILPSIIDEQVMQESKLMASSLIEPTPAKATSKVTTKSIPKTASVNNPDEFNRATESWLKEMFSQELMIDSNTLDSGVPFADYGVDSIMLAQLLKRIQDGLFDSDEEPLDPSIFFEYPTLGDFSNWLCATHQSALQKLLGASASDEVTAETNEVEYNQELETFNTEVSTNEPAVEMPVYSTIQAPVQHKKEEPKETSKLMSGGDWSSNDIAVIGMACQFPGANDLEGYWQLLSEGRSAITKVPSQRWGFDSGRYAALMENVTHFDPGFFLLGDNDAKAMDPQALLLLEQSLKAFCQAGYSLDEVKGSQTGVFIGARSNHQPEANELAETTNPILAVGQNYLAANISRFFDLHGPSLVSDTACSSALVNMNMAMQYLHSGEISSALVGGISVLQNEGGHRLFEQRKILSSGGEFHLFDSRSNGVVLGEGVGMVLLKKLDQAIADGDQIHAVVKSLAINNDGRTAGPASPNFNSQKAVMQNALDKAAVTPNQVSYIEMNGSGSEVTDLLELKSVESVYRSADKSVPCEIGSMEPNIGHPLCAKGIASFIKVALLLSRQQQIPFLSGQQPMAHYDIDASPFYFSREMSDVDKAHQKTAAINCFADGGTNAHVILASWHETTPRPIKRSSVDLPQLNRRAIFPVYDKVADTPVWNFRESENGTQLLIDINHPIMRNHKAYGQELLPGLAYIELLFQLFKRKGYDFEQLEVRNLSIYTPLTVSESYGVVLDFEVTENEQGVWQIALEGREQQGDTFVSDKKRYAVAQMRLSGPVTYDENLDLNEVKRHATLTLDLADLYHQCSLQGLNHTGLIKAQGQIMESPESTCIDIQVGPDAESTADGYLFHPTLIDGSSVGAQRLFTSMFEGENRLILPLFYESFRATALLQRDCVTRIQTSSLRRKNELIYMNLEFFDQSGKKVAELLNYACKLVRDEGAINPNRKKPAQSQDKRLTAAKTATAEASPKLIAASDSDVVLDYLLTLMSQRTGVEVDDIDTTLGYYELGLDSAKLLDLVGELEQRVGDTLAPTLLFEYTNIEELAGYLEDKYPDKWVEEKQVEQKSAEQITPVESIAATTNSTATNSVSEAEDFLVELMAKRTGVEPDDVDLQLGYYELGLDSAKLLELVGELEQKVGDTLAPTLLFEHTNIEELAAYLTETYPDKWQNHVVEKVSEDKVGSTPTSTQSVKVVGKPNQGASVGDIAIIGMAGQYPGAKDLEEFWQNLEAGTDSIVEVPESRWSRDRLNGMKTPSGGEMSRFGGFIDDPDCFDAGFFRVSPWEAKLLDPQQRLFLQVCWHAMEDAGYTPQNLVQPRGRNQRRDVGVYVGVMHNDYAMLTSDAVLMGQHSPISLNYAQIANRVSFFCDFNGPSVALDTVCSSSLIAIHQAIESIRNGESEVALAGGVNLSIHPNKYMTYGMMGMHSSDGRCRAFGADGDGYVSAEGIGAVLLKPLDKAEADNDHIYAVIKGSTTNHVGSVSGLTVPCPVAQADMIESCIEKTGIHPRTISYVEAHGTGTSLGDPIEVKGLVKSFGHYTDDKQYCSIGSVKSNIGHAESAAGVSGLHKLALQLKHKTLVPSLHSKTINPYLDFANSPFYVQQDLAPWKKPVIEENGQSVTYPRRGAISSFGATGSNAHVILEEYIPTKAQLDKSKEPDSEQLVLLSAKKPDRLQAYAEQLLDFLSEENNAVTFSDLVYTLQVGRIEMEQRLAIVAKSKVELIDKLRAFVNGEPSNNEIGDAYFTAKIKKGKKARSLDTQEAPEAVIGKWIAQGEIAKVAQNWINGVVFDWALVQQLNTPNYRPSRIKLPGYPFAKDSHWLTMPESGVTITAPQITSADSSQQGSNSEQTLVANKTEVDASEQAEMLYYSSHWQPQALADSETLLDRKTTVFVASDLVKEIESLGLADEVIGMSTNNDVAEQVYQHTIQLLNYCQSPNLKEAKKQLLVVYVPHSDQDYSYLSLQGTLRTIALEFPYISTKLVLDEALTSRALMRIENNLKNELSNDDHFSEIAYLKDKPRQVLSRELVNPKESVQSPIRQNGVYWITGGLGGLGRMFTEHLGKDTQAQFILTGRSMLGSQQKAQLDSLRAKGLKVEYYSCDTGTQSDVTKMVAHIVQEYGGLHGIIHSAGVIADNFVSKKKEEEVRKVLSAKVQAAINLDIATKELALDFFVLFSSMAALGNVGQLDYATANAFLDAFAVHRQNHRPGKSLSINWPLWKDGGMTVEAAYEKYMLENFGIVPLEPQSGLNAFNIALASEYSQFGVMQGFKEKVAPLLAGKTDKTAKTTTRQSSGKSMSAEQQEKVRSAVLMAVGDALGMTTDEIDLEAEFVDYGMDSISATKIASQINEQLGLDYTGAVFLELDTTEKLINYLYEEDSLNDVDEVVEISQENDEVKAEVQQASKQKTSELKAISSAQCEAALSASMPKVSNANIGIIGFDGIFPEAENIDAYWKNLSNQSVLMKPVSRQQWQKRGVDLNVNGNDAYPSMEYSALIEDIAGFDPEFWGISDEEAVQMDPQQRLLMQSIWRCVEQSGYSMKQLTKKRVGLFLAIDALDYRNALRAHDNSFGMGAGISVGMIANQISYHCDFRGPSEVIDNACASSFVALKRASQAIAIGECEVAIVGGAKLLLDPLEFEGRDKGGILSRSGNMFPFDARADGYIRGEGVGCLMLKSLHRASIDHDKVHAEIIGVGTSHSGHGSLSMIAPNVEGQYQAIRDAYEFAGIAPETVNYIEAHGTANNFSDAAEVAAFKQFFKESMEPSAYQNHQVALSTVKGNTGHLEGASGIASLIKVLCAIKHKKIAPTANLQQTHPSILLKGSPFYFPQSLTDWPSAQGENLPRRAGLHSIGIGGVNAHVILQEHIEHASNPHEKVEPMKEGEDYELLVISAKSKAALKAYIQKWFRFVNTETTELPSLTQLAYSSQVSRNEMTYRIALVVNSIDELKQQLAAEMANVDQIQPIEKQNSEYVLESRVHTKTNLLQLATAWKLGKSIDWKYLAGSTVSGVVTIPDYPFQNKPIWYSDNADVDPFDKLFEETFASAVLSD